MGVKIDAQSILLCSAPSLCRWSTALLLFTFALTALADEINSIHRVAATSDQPASPDGHWAFRSVRRPDVPQARNAKWPRTALDPFILARLEREQLKPAPEADPVTL